MIHQIKAMYDEGRGSSIREIARALKISRNTVRKYLALDEASINAQQRDRSRIKALDVHRDYLVHLLETFPKLSAVKVERKLREKVGPLDVSSRSIRRYVSALKADVVQAQRRYYEPVLEHVPGVQCQVDPGELRDVLIGGVATTVYFVVFVLSFSRLMYVGTSRRPIDTTSFMRLHDAAFRYFGGCPEECVYDQTRLVVLDEQYRELELNPRFAQYATTAGFRIRACAGYDPESKGKVEAGVKYVKHNALAGETFIGWSDLDRHLAQWLDAVANQRTHATTGEVPQAHYQAEEQAKMRPYLSPACLTEPGETRKADKTGLIAYRGNKYSVPMAYQSARVSVVASPDGQLRIHAAPGGACIATHTLHPGKGAILKNRDHYRDKAQAVAELEAEIQASLGDELGPRLCQRVRASEPRHYTDQLRGLKRHLSRLQQLPHAAWTRLLDKDRLTVLGLLEYLSAFEANPERFEQRDQTRAPTPDDRLQADALTRYAGLTQPANPEANHGLH